MCRMNFFLALTLVVCSFAITANADTILFKDNFDSSAGYWPDINGGIGTDAWRVVSGKYDSARYVCYAYGGTQWSLQVGAGGTWGTTTVAGRELLIGHNSKAGLDRNFNGVDSLGGLTIGVDIKPAGLNFAASWGGISFGQSSSAVGSTAGKIDASPGGGFKFFGNGALHVFDNGVQLTNGTWGAGDAFHHFQVKLTGVGDANPFDGAGKTMVELFVDGGTTPVYTYTTTAVNGYASNYIKLYGDGATDDVALYNDLTITQIPEPGTLALLASGLVGLLCYAWRKRR